MGITKKIKIIIVAFNNKFANLFKTKEEIFYENFFTQNPYWSTSKPNDDEQARWGAINKLIDSQFSSSRNLKILDVGCGRGWLSNLLTQYGSVVGVEPVKNVVKYAKKIFPNVEFIVGSTPSLLPKYSGNFDLIVCSEVLEHISDDKKSIFISEVYTLLKENGCAIFSTPRADIQVEWLSFVGAEQPIEDWISEDDLEKLFNKNKFKTLSVERVSISPKVDVLPLPIYQVWLFKK